jgi:hypothetical protein
VKQRCGDLRDDQACHQLRPTLPHDPDIGQSQSEKYIHQVSLGS